MRFQLVLVSAVTLALAVCGMPTSSYDDFNVDLDLLSYNDASALPESGQIVFTPFELDASGFEAMGESEDDAIMADWKTEVVRQHNAYRAKYGASPLTWDEGLYAGTNQWARGCKFQHSNGKGQYGENLAAGTGNSYGFSTGLKDWMDEASKYDYNKPGFTPGTGHFTQVVWKSSKGVACYISNCPGGTIFQQPSKYVVCRYSPPGNFQGRFKENVGMPRK